MATANVPDHQDAVAGLARAGYAARGIVYLLVGGLATLAVVGQGGKTTDSRGALETLLTAPAGDVLLGLIAVGLLGYGIWRVVQAGKDTDHHGTDAKGLAIRGSLVVSAVLHVVLAVYVVSLIFTLGGGGGGSGSGGGSEGFASWLMGKPYGPLLVGIAGGLIIAAGIAHTIKGWQAKFEKYLQMPPGIRRWGHPVSRFGLVTRGFVLMIIGGFFVAAAYQYDPSQAGGLGEVFGFVRQQAYGLVLLGVVAVGLFAFGVYSLLEAMYRRL